MRRMSNIFQDILTSSDKYTPQIKHHQLLKFTKMQRKFISTHPHIFSTALHIFS